MELPRNRFKAALRGTRPLVGIWNTLGGNSVPEMLAGSGFDWVLVDCEHAAIETVEVLPALQAIGQYSDCSAIVRPAANDAVLFKRLLDMGAQTLLVPYVETAEAARSAVAATRYAPRGIRGMAGGTRATRYGRVTDYFTRADDEICVLLQIESARGIENLDEIATTDGVDGIFIGPADLSASLGHPGDPGHPEVRRAIDDILDRLDELDVPSGILALGAEAMTHAVSRRVNFVGAGVDAHLLAGALDDLRAQVLRD